MAVLGHGTGRDHHDCVSDRALSNDCLKIDKGSAMGSDRAALWGAGIGHAEVRLLSLKADTEAVPMEVAKEQAGEAWICFRLDSLSLLILATCLG